MRGKHHSQKIIPYEKAEEPDFSSTPFTSSHLPSFGTSCIFDFCTTSGGWVGECSTETGSGCTDQQVQYSDLKSETSSFIDRRGMMVKAQTHNRESRSLPFSLPRSPLEGLLCASLGMHSAAATLARESRRKKARKERSRAEGSGRRGEAAGWVAVVGLGLSHETGVHFTMY